MSAKCPIVVTVILTSIHLEQTMLFASKAKHTLSCHPASNLLFIVVEIVMCTTDCRLCASVTVSLLLNLARVPELRSHTNSHSQSAVDS